MADYKKKIEELQAVIKAAETEQGKLEGRKQQLEETKKEILAGFAELGIKPKDAPAEVERLDAEIAKLLGDAEKIVREFKDAIV